MIEKENPYKLHAETITSTQYYHKKIIHNTANDRTPIQLAIQDELPLCYHHTAPPIS